MKTHKFCPKCGRPVVKAKRSATMDRYPYECFACDENFFRFEVIGKKDIELARTLQEQDYQEGLSDGIFMPSSYRKPYPRPEPTKHQRVNNSGRNPKKKK